jgi:hypothetical protein
MCDIVNKISGRDNSKILYDFAKNTPLGRKK